MTDFLTILLGLAIIGLFFYLGLYIGYSTANRLTKSEIDNTQKLIIKKSVYRVYKHCDLDELSSFPDELNDIPESRNQEII